MRRVTEQLAQLPDIGHRLGCTSHPKSDGIMIPMDRYCNYNIMQIQKYSRYILVYEMALITNTVGLRVVTATTQLLGACDAG